MIESNSVRRALSQLREELSPTRDDKARLRARILAPAALLATDAAGPDAQAPTATARASGHGAVAHDRAAHGAAAHRLVGPATAAQVAAHVASLTPWAALKAAGAVGAALGVALLAVGSGVGFWLGQEAASAHLPSATVDLPAPAPGVDRGAAQPVRAAAPTPPQPVAEVAPAPSAPNQTRRAVDSPRNEAPPRAHTPQRRDAPNQINDELALLRRVERALRNNDPAFARALLGELDERFPNSRLGEERAAARRIADCRSGEPDAREGARAFLREHVASVYRKRIALACALDGNESQGIAPMKNVE